MFCGHIVALRVLAGKRGWGSDGHFRRVVWSRFKKSDNNQSVSCVTDVAIGDIPFLGRALNSASCLHRAENRPQAALSYERTRLAHRLLQVLSGSDKLKLDLYYTQQ